MEQSEPADLELKIREGWGEGRSTRYGEGVNLKYGERGDASVSSGLQLCGAVLSFETSIPLLQLGATNPRQRFATNKNKLRDSF